MESICTLVFRERIWSIALRLMDRESLLGNGCPEITFWMAKQSIPCFFFCIRYRQESVSTLVLHCKLESMSWFVLERERAEVGVYSASGKSNVRISPYSATTFLLCVNFAGHHSGMRELQT